MSAVRDRVAEPITAETATPSTIRRIGLVPSASMILFGAAIATVWLCLYIMIVIVGLWLPRAIVPLQAAVSFVPSGIGLAPTFLLFVYLMRGVEWVERRRSEAVFGMGIPASPRRISADAGFQCWLHQLWLDISNGRFWKGCAHHSLRLVYDVVAVGLALVLLVFAVRAPATVITVTAAISPPDCHYSARAGVSAGRCRVGGGHRDPRVAPVLDAAIDRWPLSPSSTATLR